MKKKMLCMMIAALMVSAVPAFAAEQGSGSDNGSRYQRDGRYGGYCGGYRGNGQHGGCCWYGQEDASR